jgi:hypothetical protein
MQIELSEAAARVLNVFLWKLMGPFDESEAIEELVDLSDAIDKEFGAPTPRELARIRGRVVEMSELEAE